MTLANNGDVTMLEIFNVAGSDKAVDHKAYELSQLVGNHHMLSNAYLTALLLDTARL